MIGWAYYLIARLVLSFIFETACFYFVVVNIGTSAQVALVLTSADVAKFSSCFDHKSSFSDVRDNSSFEVRPFLFEDRYVGVAASLSGCVQFALSDQLLIPACFANCVVRHVQRQHICVAGAAMAAMG